MRTTRSSSSSSSAVPIPSFETAASVPASPPPTAASLRWNYLLQVEAALQLRFKNRKHVVVAGGDAQKKKIISLEEFYALVKRLHLSLSTSSSHNSSHEDTPVLLCTEEQVLHDLVCVSAPILYRMVETPLEDDHAEATPSWSLESVEFSGNRLLELKKLLQHLDQTPPDWSKKSSSVVDMIKSHRERQQQQQQPQAMDVTITTDTSDSVSPERQDADTTNSTRTAKGALSEPYIHEGMSLDERVRARAAATKIRQSNALKTAAATAAVDGKKEDSSSSSVLLAYADALWSHARYIMSRYQSSIRYRLASPSTKKTVVANCCIMTLKDVVEVLSRTTTNQRAAAAASRRQLVEAVQQLSQLAPEWIILTDPEGDGKSSGSNDGRQRLSKQTTVWIKPVEYGVIRTRLGGASKENSSNTAAAAPSPILVDVSGATSAVASKRHAAQEPQDNSSQVTPVTKRARTHLDKSITGLPEGENGENDSDSATALKKVAAKRPPPNNKEIGAVVSIKPQRFRMGLRVNKNLIFTDADYDGGEIIEPTQFDSPRGLKRLFAQLNSGQRI